MKSDKDFVKDWNKSHNAVSLIAEFLTRIGFDIQVPELKLRESSKDRLKYTDDGDLLCEERRIEVKHSSKNFSCADDYPFRSIIIDEEYKIKDRLHTLKFYVIVSQDMKYAAFIKPKTSGSWVVKVGYDRYQERVCTWVKVPKELAVYIPLE
jgi:hypothetical protein